MTTKYFKLPEIDPNAKFDGANDINELATAVDHALQHVEEVGKDSHYVLPAATKTKLGGVIAGDNVEVESDGTISVNVNPYVLPPASYSKLGGVIVQKEGGLQLDTDGTLHVDNSVIGVPEGSVTTSKIRNEAIVTDKIADNAVTVEKLGPALKAQIEKMEKINEGVPTEVPFTDSSGDNITNLSVKANQIAGVMQVKGTCQLTADGSTTSWTLGTIGVTSGSTPANAEVFSNEICGYAKSISDETQLYPIAIKANAISDSSPRRDILLTLPEYLTKLPADTYEVVFSILTFIYPYS